MKTAYGLAVLLVAGACLTATATVPGGPKRTVERVLANDTDVYRVVFSAGETATVLVSGDGDTDLDLYVYDESGNLITKDDDMLDDCVVTWTPRWTGKFEIRVVNRGSVFNEYLIVAN